MTSVPKQERVARWILLSIAVALLGWGLFEFLHDDYRPPREPTDPYDIEAKRVAHSIKLPDSVPKASYYPWWLGSKRYFEFLCKHEAGEWVFRTVDDVDGVFQMRPRPKATSADFEDKFSMEDPYGYTGWEASAAATLFLRPKRGYSYFETPLPPNRAFDRLRRPREVQEAGEGSFWRYSDYIDRSQQTPALAVRAPDRRARYGFTWRGVRRPHDRELAIAGGELIVVDLQTNEVLAVRRGFTRTGYAKDSPGGINWEFSGACPELERPSDGKRVGKDVDFTYWFVRRVLRPQTTSLMSKGDRL
jgi:hypothetical protein